MSTGFDAALAVISEHNEAVGGNANNGLWIDPDKFSAAIKAQGFYGDHLAKVRYENVASCLPKECVPAGVSTKDAPIVVRITEALRGKAIDSGEPQVGKTVSAKKADLMTPAQLVEHFQPEDYDNPVGRVLARKSKGEPIVVYKTGRVVDRKATLKQLEEVIQGYPGLTEVEVDGEIRPVYRVGELPDNFADENPLYIGRPLRPDGICDQTGRSWAGIDHSTRQLVRVAVKLGELDVDINTAHQILDMLLKPNGTKDFRNRYRKSAVAFDKMLPAERPTLLLPLGNRKGGQAAVSGNPFRGR